MNNSNGMTGGQKLWLGMAVIGAGVSLWLLVMVGRMMRENKQSEAKINELVNKLVSVEELETNKELLEHRFRELEEFFLKGETGVAAVAESMEEIASQAGVGLVLSFEDFPDQVDIGGVYQQGLGVYIEVEGSYQQVLDWLKRVESLPYFISLPEVKIGAAKLGPGIKAEFKGVIFLKND